MGLPPRHECMEPPMMSCDENFFLTSYKGMSLTELSTAIPERLPAQLNFADLGSQFQAVTGKRSVHIQPSAGNTFSPDGIRVIRFNITGEGYIVPESFRLQAKFTVLGDQMFKPVAPMSCLFERVRVISSGQVLSDENYFDRLQALHHEWMDKEQYKELCNESFAISRYDLLTGHAIHANV